MFVTRAMPLLLCLGLSACIDAELSLTFIDAETVDTDVSFTMARQLYDLTSTDQDDPCPEGEGTLTAETFRCDVSKSLTLDEIIAGGAGTSTETDIDLSKGLLVERVGDTQVRVTIDFIDLADNQPPTDDMEGMEDMIRAAMAGHSLIFNVSGYKIIETNGALNEGGTRATRIIPIVVMLDAEPDFGPPFVTLVQLTQSCRFLGLICD